jgi:prepilin signal peptidase PulO-like enzyme (type II secretory pathway)
VALSFRSRLEHASYPWVERLNAVPRPVALGGLVVLLAVGILAPRPWGGIAFLVVAAFVGWLLFLTWHRLTLPERLMRTAVLVLSVAVAVVRIVPAG